MENQLIRAEQKLSMIARHAPMGLAEIDGEGEIIEMNLKGESLLKPVIIAHDLRSNNFYAILDYIAPGVTDKIRAAGDEAGPLAGARHSAAGLTVPKSQSGASVCCCSGEMSVFRSA